MKVEIVPSQQYVLVKVHGLLDEACKAEFDEQIHPLIDTGTKKLLVDLSGSDRVTSAGIGHLVTLVSRANAKGGSVVFVNPSPFIKLVFHTTKLTKFFDVEETTEAGIQRLLEG
jgi:anti-anti-sigma factor